MADKILNIIEDNKTKLQDSEYKDILENLMIINNKQEVHNKEIENKEIVIKNLRNKITRLINRYMDLSLSFNTILLEREGIISDKFLFTDECITDDCIHSIIV